MSQYLRGLLSSGQITAEEYRVLAPSGVRSAREMYAVTLHFGRDYVHVLPGGNLAKISELAARGTPMTFRESAMAAWRAPLQFAMGAKPPPNTPYPIGHAMGLGATPTPAPSAGQRGRIDHHSALRAAGWPIKQQGQRGTCVAHAMISCIEHHRRNGQNPPDDHSEQFLFWAAKQFDPDPTDGTSHDFAMAALKQLGCCDEAAWPYVGTTAATVHQGPPPPAAVHAAGKALHGGGGMSAPSNAAALYLQLQNGPVSIGVPVFVSLSDPSKTNWNVGGMMQEGIVAEPAPNSVVGGGHAVCVVGFEPDPTEAGGEGWFIFRNSWGNQFGQKLPVPGAGSYGPEVGYGQIGWAHVDKYLWEMAWL